MRVIGIFLLMLMVLPLSSAVYSCNDDTDFRNIPCEVVTPVLDCVGNLTIINLNDTDDNYTLILYDIGGGIYNATFTNNSYPLSYSLETCDNSTATLNVGSFDEEYNNKYLYLYLTLFLISGTLYYFGLTLPDITMKFFAGLTLTLTGITLITIGYPTLTDTLLKDGFSVITMGVGLYMMISIGMKWIKEGGL